MNLGRFVVDSARRFPERVAVRWGERVTTYAELDRRTNALAHGLASLGVRKGDRVAVLMRNRPEMIETMFACFKAGYCLVPLNSRFTPGDISYHVDDAAAAAVVTDAEGSAVVGAPEVADRPTVVAGDAPDGHPDRRSGRAAAWVDFEELVAGGDPSAADVRTDRDDLAWLFYTSGTTGRPKGAMLSHGMLGFVTASWLADVTPLDERDVTLHAAPLSHGAGFHAIASVARGAQQLLPDGARFDPPAILDLLADAGVTNTWLVPTQIVMLLDALGGRRPDLPRLRYLVYGGAPFAPADLRQALDTFGPVLVQIYGQGETPMTATWLPARDHAEMAAGGHVERLASAGIARPGMDVRVMGDGDEELPAGQVGEVCVRGNAVMLGYWNRPDASAETLRNGWLHTGDLGRIDEHGYLYLLDRAKDLIITGGSNVYAVEVEAVLADHPAVQEVAVVGVADRTWGELVTAVVVPRGCDDPAQSDPAQSDLAQSDLAQLDLAQLERALLGLSAERLAGYKRPRRVVFRASLPRNAYGKVLKRDLRLLN